MLLNIFKTNAPDVLARVLQEENKLLKEENSVLKSEIFKLAKQIEELKDKLNINSSNSGLPTLSTRQKD